MRVLRHINRIFNSVSYLIINDDTAECWMIDAGDKAPIMQLIGTNNLKGIFLTHSHYDHIYGLNDFYDIYPECQIYTNRCGLEALTDTTENLSFYHDAPFKYTHIENVKIVGHHENVQLANGKGLKAIYTPGHHTSCISWLFEDILFTGDSYIPGRKTETRLPGSSPDDALKSVEYIKTLGIERKIFSGHMPLNH